MTVQGQRLTPLLSDPCLIAVAFAKAGSTVAAGGRAIMQNETVAKVSKRHGLVHCCLLFQKKMRQQHLCPPSTWLMHSCTLDPFY